MVRQMGICRANHIGLVGDGFPVPPGRARTQAVTNLVCHRSAFGYRSVSFYGSINWNLQMICNADVGADALIGPRYNVTNSPERFEYREPYSAGR